MENTLIFLLVIAIIIILLLWYYLYKCRNLKRPDETLVPFPHVPYDKTQILLWKKPEATPDEFKAFISNNFPQAKASDVKYCGDCDNSLVLILNIDIDLFLTTQTPTPAPSKPNIKPSGVAGAAYYSPNFAVEFKDRIDRSQKRSYCHETISINTDEAFTQDTVTVAVFDTGVEAPLISSQLYNNNNASCLGAGADNGWNFANHNANWRDENSFQHGSVVAKIIVDQSYESSNNIKILPVKVFSENGIGLLSDVLCALQYAKNRGANIINASFGFYAPLVSAEGDPAASGVLLLQNFLEAYFKNSKILMIAAAGNIDNPNEDCVFTSADPTAKRNLENVNFFPASFARHMQNVIAVTTASTETNAVSPHQNFSAHVVDIGVNADVVVGEDYLFLHPFESNSTVEGSSFATPVVTGKIAANYHLLKDMQVPVNKQYILNKLTQAGLIFTGDISFENLIKHKRMMKK